MKTLRISGLFLFTLIGLFALNSCDSGDDDEETTPSTANNNNQTQTASLPSTVAGQVVTMKFTAPQTGAPYALDQEVKFTFSSSGMLFIDDDPNANDGDEITISSFTKVGNEFVWKDSPNDYSYALSLKSDSSINEVNVSQTSTSSFLGQFIPTNSGSGTSLVANYQGTYTVNSVDKGTHNRMTIVIDAQGNIDFDTNTQLNASDFSSVTDRLDCCDGIWIDMNPYPTTPYPRVNLFIDTNSTELNKIEYMPNYPNISGRVHVNISKDNSGSGSNGLTVSGDASKVGGTDFAPAQGVECTSCASSQLKVSWEEDVSGSADKVFTVDIISATSVVIDFSASSSFRATGTLTSLGIVHDATAKTFTFSNTSLNERFSQPGTITVNGTLSY